MPRRKRQKAPTQAADAEDCSAELYADYLENSDAVDPLQFAALVSIGLQDDDGGICAAW